MLLTVFSFLTAIQIPLLATAAPNLKTCTENGKLNPDASKPTSTTYLPDALISTASRVSSAPSTVASWQKSRYHGNTSSIISEKSGFRGLKTASRFGILRPSDHSQGWNASLGSPRATVTVSNCSQLLSQNTPEPKCVCPHLPTSTVVITVTATINPDCASSSNAGGQTLPSVPTSPLQTALYSSLGEMPVSRFSSSQALIVPSSITSKSGHHSIEQTSSPNFRTLSTSSLNYPVGPTRSISNPSPSNPMNDKLPPAIDDPSIGFVPTPANAVSNNTTRTSTTRRPCSKKIKPTLQSTLPSVNLKVSSAYGKENPKQGGISLENLEGSKLSHLLHPTNSAPTLSTWKYEAGSTTPVQVPASGQKSHALGYGYSIVLTIPSVSSFLTPGAPSPHSAQNLSLQSSFTQTSLPQLPSSQSRPYHVPMSPIPASGPSLQIPPTQTSSISLPSAVSSLLMNTTTSLQPLTATEPLSSILLISSPGPTAPATPFKPAGAPYTNTSQAMNLNASGQSTDSPNRPSQLAFPTHMPLTSPRPQNVSLHPVICFPNTTSMTHILANYDSPRLNHQIRTFYRGLNYTSFALSNSSASTSPPNYLASAADTPLKQIAITSAPFLSFSLRSLALSCLPAGTLPQPSCTVLISGTKASEALPGGTHPSSQVTRLVTVTGTGSGTAQRMMKVDLQGDAGDWTGLKSVSFDATIDGKPAGLGIDDLEYDLKTKGCYFNAEW